MITDIASWRCECGVSLTAVTQTDRADIDEIERLIARCPNCGREQILYAHRLIGVRIEQVSSHTAARDSS
jgi:ribosomal protein S27AE